MNTVFLQRLPDSAVISVIVSSDTSPSSVTMGSSRTLGSIRRENTENFFGGEHDTIAKQMMKIAETAYLGSAHQDEVPSDAIVTIRLSDGLEAVETHFTYESVVSNKNGDVDFVFGEALASLQEVLLNNFEETDEY